MNVNEVLGRDTEPLFFLNCIACDKPSEDTVAIAAVAGIDDIETDVLI